VTVLSAPPGSGKTVLLHSWITEAGLSDSAAWVSVERDACDTQRFWVPVVGALRRTIPGAAVVRPLTAAPDLDGWAVVERLLKDLAPLEDRVWLVIDDAHELGPAETMAQLELLVMRAPPELRFVLATRHDVRLGLHRLRLEGELTELRVADLRFSLAEARALFAAAGVELPEPALAMLHERTEGWAAGLRLAALSLAGHPDPERFAAEFSGSERTVADYLLAEVLERQNEEVRRLLLRTSILDRVSGPLADALTGGSGAERALQELEEANAFVVSVDAARSWFRYHRLFADLLQLELRRAEPGRLTALHQAAAGWYAGHGHPVEAVRHAQAAENWALAARLLSDHWPRLSLGGRGAILNELLARFPSGTVAADPELTMVRAADELGRGSLEEAGRQVALATSALASVPPDRRERIQVLLAGLRVVLARQRMDVSAVVEEAQRLLAPAAAADAARLGLGEDVRTVALINLGTAEIWALRFEDAERHLEQAIALARRIGREYTEFYALAHWTAGLLLFRPEALQPERLRQAVELAERNGWDEDPLAGVVYTVLAGTLLYRGRLAEIEHWLGHAERTLPTEAEPAAGMTLRHVRAVLEMARGRYREALAAFAAAEKLAPLVMLPASVTSMRSRRLQALARVGETGRAEAALAELDSRERASAKMRTAAATLRLAQDDPQAAADELAPVLDAPVPGVGQVTYVTALLLEAQARDKLGDHAAAAHALERALDITGSGGMLLPYLLDATPVLLERHRRRGTAHSALISQILHLPAPGTGGYGETASPTMREGLGETAPPGQALLEPLTGSETRVLRYLPTRLTAQEIAGELFVSVHTVTTHMRHLYAKLGVHRRHEAVARARALGLLAPSAHRSPRRTV
jgi:LuxR family maltose regulon positive regulatory protein